MAISNAAAAAAFSHTFRIIIVGESAAGKSSLLLQFSGQEFRPHYEVSIGVEFGARIVRVHGDKQVKLQIWDTAGSERFDSITRTYLRNPAGALLMYDCTQRETFDRLAYWLGRARENNHPELVVMLIGNKTDLVGRRLVSTEEGAQFAQEHGLMFLETSAKHAVNVQDAFVRTATAIYDNVLSGAYNVRDERCGVKLPPQVVEQAVVVIQQQQQLTLTLPQQKTEGGGCWC